MNNGSQGASASPPAVLQYADGKKEIMDQNDEILRVLQESQEYEIMSSQFGKIIDRIVYRLSEFSGLYEVGYHVVIFSESNGRRYSIIEGDQATINSKPLYYGIVGSFLKKKNMKDHCILVQYGTGDLVEPVCYQKKANTDKSAKMKKSLMQSTFGDELNWKKPDGDDTGNYAIAATQIFSKGADPVGIFTIDFTSATYPNFAFRNAEVDEIFACLEIVKEMFELIIDKTDIDVFYKALNVIKGYGGANVHNG